MKDNWHIILSTVDNNKIVPSEDMPKESGNYLCTCVKKIHNAFYNYLQMMYFNAETMSWSDIGNDNGISHNILAWRDDIEPCKFNEYNYVAGEFIKE